MKITIEFEESEKEILRNLRKGSQAVSKQKGRYDEDDADVVVLKKYDDRIAEVTIALNDRRFNLDFEKPVEINLGV